MSEMASNERSAGALLRAARERQGLHIAALAAAIKVAPRKLEALEGDRLSELPDATFARALAQTVCRTLKIDAQPVLALLPPAGGVGFQSAGASLNAPFREKPGREERPSVLASVKPLVWLGVLLLLAAVAVYFWPANWSIRNTLPTVVVPPPAASAVVADGAAAASNAMAAAPPPLSTSGTVPGGAAVNAPVPGVAATTSAANTGAANSGAANSVARAASGVTGETVFSAPQQPQADATPPAGAVQLRVTEASWMDVRDAKGQVLLSRMVQPGESVGLDGAAPIRLTIGNAAATQLGYKGQAINIAPFTAGNVARLELR
jgi:cytoskeleton protein RodZ